jgi:hypothetical protein
MKPFIITFTILAWTLTSYLPAQTATGTDSPAPLKVTKISGGITFDGVPDEASWQAVEALPLVMFMPEPGKTPTEVSIIRMAYDDEYFYVSGILNYQDMNYLRAIGKQRDYTKLSTDWMGLTLDTFNDRENAVQFSTNPNGLRRDATIQNDCLVEDIDRNHSWNTFWDVKTRMAEQ